MRRRWRRDAGNRAGVSGVRVRPCSDYWTLGVDVSLSHDAQIILDLEDLTSAAELMCNVLKGGGLDKHGHGKHRKLSRDEHGLKMARHLTTPGADEECEEHHAMNAATRALMIAANVHATSHTGAALSRNGALKIAVLLVNYAASGEK